MRVRSIRGIDQPISVIGLGTMMFGAWGNNDRDECRRIADIALDHDINLFDTADIYDRGIGEEIVGEVIKGRRHRIVLATKVGNPMSDDPSERGLSRRWITTSCRASLRRLGVDHIDLYQMHRPDPSTPLLESIEAMHDLVQAGLIRAWGTSTFAASTIEEIVNLAAAHSLTPPSTEQPPYSMLCRLIEQRVIPTCVANGIGLVTWAPLNGGWLTGKYAHRTPEAASRAVRESDHFDWADERIRAEKIAAVGRLADVAAQHGTSLAHLALRFVAGSSAVASCLIGPRTPQQALELATVDPTPLDAATLAVIDTIVAPGVTINPRDNG